jgi:hypothetical protein
MMMKFIGFKCCPFLIHQSGFLLNNTVIPLMRNRLSEHDRRGDAVGDSMTGNFMLPSDFEEPGNSTVTPSTPD